MQMRKVMTPYVNPLQHPNTQSRITLDILKQCALNLAPTMYITKGTKWQTLCHCHDNSCATVCSGKTPWLTLKGCKWGYLVFHWKDWSQECCHGNNIVDVILFLLRCTLLVPTSKKTALKLLQLFAIECCAVLVEPPMRSSLSSFA